MKTLACKFVFNLNIIYGVLFHVQSPFIISTLCTYFRQICGIPFKLLDKKSEKLTLAARYRALSELLDDGGVLSDREILELTVMLLLQQTTSLAAVGISDIYLLIQVLISQAESVLPSAVVKYLMDATTRIKDNVSLGDVLIQRLRRMALCQNIKRYNVDMEC